jgi:hypothetical protein
LPSGAAIFCSAQRRRSSGRQVRGGAPGVVLSGRKKSRTGGVRLGVKAERFLFKRHWPRAWRELRP